MLKIILLGLAGLTGLVILFLIVVAFQPSTFLVECSLAIAASPAELFPRLNDLRQAQTWSPWTKLDPAAKYTFDGPVAGVGASNSWVGNSDIGAGRQTIVASQPNELVRIKLEFFKPMPGVSIAEFRLTPAGNLTKVSWSMSGENNFLAKAVCLFMNMDKMIGDPFEEGLANLKKQAETSAKK